MGCPFKKKLLRWIMVVSKCSVHVTSLAGWAICSYASASPPWHLVGCTGTYQVCSWHRPWVPINRLKSWAWTLSHCTRLEFRAILRFCFPHLHFDLNFLVNKNKAFALGDRAASFDPVPKRDTSCVLWCLHVHPLGSTKALGTLDDWMFWLGTGFTPRAGQVSPSDLRTGCSSYHIMLVREVG
jgi:hypothetical protein